MGRYYGPDFFKDYSLAFWYPKEWLNHEYGEWTKQSQDAFDTLYQFSGFRGTFDKILNERNRTSYFNRYGMDYSSIVDPRNALGSAPTVNASSYLTISKNISRLYR